MQFVLFQAIQPTRRRSNEEEEDVQKVRLCSLRIQEKNFNHTDLRHILFSSPVQTTERDVLVSCTLALSSELSSRSMPASVAQLDAPSDWRPGGRGFNPCRGRQHSFVEIDHEIFSTVILSLPLIQEGQLSVSGRRMCTILVNSLED